MLTVVAGILSRDGDVLICRRIRGSRHELKWEFPGGKVEPGEDPRAALERELAEELDIGAVIGREIARYPYQYPGREPILLIFYEVTAYRGEARNRVFEQIRWEKRERLPDYEFVEGDAEFVRALAAGREA
ncbi:MAG: (deoxy)nucleoside triphosphate pyrophosphohydrolase [Alphaproteobacteria bacterium]|nr:(deoxy)nucleoside triphosphate pyrophosphohydrolase [Alphaproteobacteria bacterium]